MKSFTVYCIGMLAAASTAFADPPHNLILFVPDGLRSQIVDATTAPAMARLREEGVDFRNSHALFPTFTTANASAFATGHGLGDTGDFSNAIYSGFRVASSGATVTPFLEIDPVLRQVNSFYHDNYLDEASIIGLARAHGYATALIGKGGPVAIFDVGSINNGDTLIVDDATGATGEIPLSTDWKSAFVKYKVSQTAPSRGDNGNAGTSVVPGTWIPNLAQQQYFIEATVRAVLPHFKEIGKPFVLVFWSRDPDGTQHNQGDSFHVLNPGINGPTSLAAIRNADTALASIEQALKALDLYGSTNIMVAADHGFSTISKQSRTSSSVQAPFKPGDLPLGFLAIDIFGALKARDARLRLFDPDDSYRALNWVATEHLSRGNAVIGDDPEHPQVVIASNGGSDLIYLPEGPPAWGTSSEPPPAPAGAGGGHAAQKLARAMVDALLAQDYVSGVFVDEHRFGKIPGALSTESIGVGGGQALTPHPDIVVSFASQEIDGCTRTAALCAAEIADSSLQQGQGMHGSFSRADTWNFMAARGPDFRTTYVDQLPASNADIGVTVAHLLGLTLSGKGPLAGRALTEALSGITSQERPPIVVTQTLESAPAANGLRTILKIQTLGSERYIDAAGFPGRTVGLGDRAPKQ